MSTIEEIYLKKYNIVPTNITIKTDKDDKAELSEDFLYEIVENYYKLNDLEEYYKLLKPNIKHFRTVCIGLPIDDRSYIYIVELPDIQKTFSTLYAHDDYFSSYYITRNRYEYEYQTSIDHKLEGDDKIIDFSKIFQNPERLFKIVAEYIKYKEIIKATFKLFQEDKYINKNIPDENVEIYMKEIDKIVSQCKEQFDEVVNKYCSNWE